MSRAPRKNANCSCVTPPSPGNAGWRHEHLVTSHAHQREGRGGSSLSALEAMLLSAPSFPVLSPGCGEKRPCQRGAGMTVGDRTCRRVELGARQPEIPALMRPGLKDTGWMGLSFPSCTQHSGVTLQGISSSELQLLWERHTNRGAPSNPSTMFPREAGLPFVEPVWRRKHDPSEKVGVLRFVTGIVKRGLLADT